MDPIEENLSVGKEEKIRRHFDVTNQKWYFSIVDVIAILTDSSDARNYWKVLKNRLKKADNELVTQINQLGNQLKMKARDGKYYKTDVADSDTMIRIIESIPQASVEAFKLLIQDIQGLAENLPLKPPANVLDRTVNTDAEEESAELLVDVYETESLVWIEAMVAGVLLEDLDISISPQKIIIKGKREMSENISKDYLHQELCWTSFSRTILLPFPIKTESAHTSEKNGHLTIKLAKI